MRFIMACVGAFVIGAVAALGSAAVGGILGLILHQSLVLNCVIGGGSFGAVVGGLLGFIFGEQLFSRCYLLLAVIAEPFLYLIAMIVPTISVRFWVALFLSVLIGCGVALGLVLHHFH